MYHSTLKKTLILWPLFMDGVQLPQGKSHFEEAVYFLPLISQKFLRLIFSTSEGWKAESTLEPPVVLNTGPLDWQSSALTTRPNTYITNWITGNRKLSNCLNFIKLTLTDTITSQRDFFFFRFHYYSKISVNSTQVIGYGLGFMKRWIQNGLNVKFLKN